MQKRRVHKPAPRNQQKPILKPPSQHNSQKQESQENKNVINNSKDSNIIDNSIKSQKN